MGWTQKTKRIIFDDVFVSKYSICQLIYSKYIVSFDKYRFILIFTNTSTQSYINVFHVYIFMFMFIFETDIGLHNIPQSKA